MRIQRRSAMHCIGVLAFMALLPISAANASPEQALTDPDEIMRKMKAALEPPRPSIRTIEVVLVSRDGTEAHWRAREARKHLSSGARSVFLMVEPPDLRGVALLVAEQPDGTDAQWFYLPALRRVRKMFPVGSFQSFLNTDFTYSDLGLISLERRRFELVGTATRNDGAAYEVNEIPEDRWYYSRIVNWIDVETLLPIQRDYYASSGELWKSQYFDKMTIVEGVPTPLLIRMEDQLAGGSTELRIERVEYDREIPDEVFDPSHLTELTDHPVWQQAEGSGGSQ